ncbi:hypothetical protein SDC9_57092 [bioreactor metagenome]|uniref:Uncharacterized protein n=1 Tax=bioreactor metagenome TaxID=1076179 RepID=A0A644X4N1_9ZZZZ
MSFEQGLESYCKKFRPKYHDRNRQQELRERECDGVHSRMEAHRQGQTQHVAHREIQKRNREYSREPKASPHIFDVLFFLRLVLIAFFYSSVLFDRLVAGFGHDFFDIPSVKHCRIVGDDHFFGSQVHGRIRNTGHCFGHFFHGLGTRSATHAFDQKRLFFLICHQNIARCIDCILQKFFGKMAPIDSDRQFLGCQVDCGFLDACDFGGSFFHGL